jgi:hypothetical protein
MRSTQARRSLSFPLLLCAVLLGGLAGCSDDPAAPTAPPTVQVDVTILDLHSTNPDPTSFATCQTGATVLLDAGGSEDPAGQPLTFMWRDEVDYEDGSGLYPTSDWGPGTNVLRTMELQQPAQFYTIALHHVTLTVETRDGRSASKTLRIRVTSCESCGGP